MQKSLLSLCDILKFSKACRLSLLWRLETTSSAPTGLSWQPPFRTSTPCSQTTWWNASKMKLSCRAWIRGNSDASWLTCRIPCYADRCYTKWFKAFAMGGALPWEDVNVCVKLPPLLSGPWFILLRIVFIEWLSFSKVWDSICPCQPGDARPPPKCWLFGGSGKLLSLMLKQGWQAK